MVSAPGPVADFDQVGDILNPEFLDRMLFEIAENLAQFDMESGIVVPPKGEQATLKPQADEFRAQFCRFKIRQCQPFDHEPVGVARRQLVYPHAISPHLVRSIRPLIGPPQFDIKSCDLMSNCGNCEGLGSLERLDPSTRLRVRQYASSRSSHPCELSQPSG